MQEHCLILTKAGKGGRHHVARARKPQLAELALRAMANYLDVVIQAR